MIRTDDGGLEQFLIDMEPIQLIPQSILDRIAQLPEFPTEESHWKEAREVLKQCPDAYGLLPAAYQNRGLGAVDIGGGFW